jgi:hypothetical protein
MSSQSPRRPGTPEDRFDAAFRSWAERPPRTAPEEAARRIASRLPERRLAERRSLAGRPALWLAAAAVALAAGLALVVSSLGPRWERRPPAGVPLAPAGDVLVIELDHETTLYMTLGAGSRAPI